jgi:hypothetical protein
VRRVLLRCPRPGRFPGVDESFGLLAPRPRRHRRALAALAPTGKSVSYPQKDSASTHQSSPAFPPGIFSPVVRRRHGQRRFSTRGRLDPRSGLLLYWCSPRHPCRTCDSVCIAGCPRSVRLRSRGSRIGNAKACCSWSPPVTHAGSVDLRSAAFLEPRRHNATPVVGAPKGPCPTASDARSSGIRSGTHGRAAV